MSRADGDALGIRWSLEDLADLTAEEGDTPRAWSLYDESLALSRQAGDWHSIASILRSMGDLARKTGDYARAVDLLQEALSIVDRIGDRNCSSLCLDRLAFTAAGQQAGARAAQLLGAARAFRAAAGIIAPWMSTEWDSLMADLRDQIGDLAAEAALQQGRAMTREEAIAFALAGYGPTATSASVPSAR